MQNLNRPMQPVDRDIGIWAKVLGVFGFMVLLGLFFSLGVFIIGPKLRAVQSQTPPPETTQRYVPPSRPRVNEEQPKEEEPDIQLQVTERGVGDAPDAGNVGAEPPDEVFAEKTGKNDLTIVLDGKEKRSAGDEASAPTATEQNRTGVTPKPGASEKPAATKPSATETKSAETSKASAPSTLEKPRAATEGH